MTNSADEIQIRALVENWAQAVRDKDMDGALANHTADMLMFDVPLPIQSKGIPEYRATWDLFFGVSPGGAGSFDLDELNITASDTVAFCTALIRIFDTTARLTIGLRKQDGVWLIAHEHHSYAV